MSVRWVIDRTLALCETVLTTAPMVAVAGRLRASGINPEQVPYVVARVDQDPAGHTELARIVTAGALAHAPLDATAQRYALLRTAVESLKRLHRLPVPDSVRELFCAEFQFFAGEPGEHARRFMPGSASLVSMCKTASLRRFPAGQFDWEISGIRRSDMLRVAPREIPRALSFVLFRMKGFGPVFFSHLNWRRPNVALDELEANRSYYRMARALALQPDIKGFGACSWFRSPGTHRVSPHLAWLSRVFLENGGLVLEAGPDDPNGGVLHRSKTRRQLYERGEFKPTKGLVLWPRADMIAWAAAHPELEASGHTQSEDLQNARA